MPAKNKKRAIAIAVGLAIVAGVGTQYRFEPSAGAVDSDGGANQRGVAPDATASAAAAPSRARPAQQKPTQPTDLASAPARNPEEAKLPEPLRQAMRALEPGGPAASLPNDQRVLAALRMAHVPDRFIDGDRVRMDLRVNLSAEEIDNGALRKPYVDAVVAALARDGIVASAVPGSGTLQANLPFERLREVAARADIANLRLMTMPLAAASADGIDYGAVVSEGVSSSGADIAHLGGFTGKGVTVGVLDFFSVMDVFKRDMRQLIGDGDIPTGVAYLEPGADNLYAQARLDNDPNLLLELLIRVVGGVEEMHGQGVAEIVHDMAPDAKLRLYNLASTSNANTATAVLASNALSDAANLVQDKNGNWVSGGAPRAQVLNMSFGMLGVAGDGINGTDVNRAFYRTLQAARDNGTLLVAAAGNSAGSTWFDSAPQFSFGSDNPSGNALDQYLSWSNGSKLNRIYSGKCIPSKIGALSVGLTWNDWRRDDNADGIAENVTDTDYAVELYRWSAPDYGLLGWLFGVRPDRWVKVQTGDNAQSAADKTAEPVETLDYSLSGAATSPGCATGEGVYAIAVRKKTLFANNAVRVMSWKIPLEFNSAAGELTIPGDSKSVLAVAAVDAVSQQWEKYSSRGGVLAQGGGAWDAGSVKPELSSFAGTATATYGTRPLKEGDKDHSFRGTSAASPHAAGSAALLTQFFADRRDARGDVIGSADLAGTVGNSMLWLSQRHDRGDAGYDYSYGYGVLQFQLQDFNDLYRAKLGKDWQSAWNQFLASYGLTVQQ